MVFHFNGIPYALRYISSRHKPPISPNSGLFHQADIRKASI